jgi:hypothetical protein
MGSSVNGLLNFGRPSHIPMPPSAAFGLQIARSVCQAIHFPLASRVCLSAIPEPPASKQ